MTQAEPRACPCCGTLRCVGCNAINRQQVSRFFDWHAEYPQHTLVMVPVVHRHPSKRADHAQLALDVSIKRPVVFPLQGFHYPEVAGSSKES